MSEANEGKREEIQKEARRILDSFARSLAKVKFKEREERRELGGFREEGKGRECDYGFRENVCKCASQKWGCYYC